MARVLIPLADGVEELEAVALIDILRRGGCEVVAAGLNGLTVRASRGVRLLADATWEEASRQAWDAVVLPGGAGGAEALQASPSVLETIRRQAAADKWVCAICAAPLVLQAAGILKGRQATAHPAVRDRLTEPALRDARVVRDGKILTSQGPGTAIEFALEILRLLEGADKADRVAAGLVLPQ